MGLRGILQCARYHNRMVEAVNMACYLINISPRASLAGKVAEESMLQQKKNMTVVDFEQFPVEEIETSQPNFGGSATDDLQDYSLARDRENDKWMVIMVKEMVHTSIRAVLVLVASWDLYLEHMDVKTAFLHGDLEKHIYMRHPEALMMVLLFFLLLYVDDMLIDVKNMYDVIGLKTLLSQEFDMKDLGAAKKILGKEICMDKDSRKLWLSQRGYVEKMLERFAMSSAKPVSTPLANHFKLSLEQCPKIDKEAEDMKKVLYSNVVGCLMYAMVCTRPNLAYVVSQVCKYMSKPDYAGHLDNRRSTIGYVFTLGGGPICWKSIVPYILALSTTKAEYMAAAEAAKEALWLTGLVKELGVQQGGVQLLCDNQSNIHLDKNQVYRARTNHIDVRFHNIRELVTSGEILFQKLSSHFFGDLLDSIIVDVASECHRIAKLGLDRNLEEEEEEEEEEMRLSAQAQTSVADPNNSGRFAPHFEKCMGKSLQKASEREVRKGQPVVDILEINQLRRQLFCYNTLQTATLSSHQLHTVPSSNSSTPLTISLSGSSSFSSAPYLSSQFFNRSDFCWFRSFSASSSSRVMWCFWYPCFDRGVVFF
ncbi:hypothetical protein F3Y22_tig00111036pilonHSYRG00002 [Hibiscus syriacus]|uniref:Reverse transcriptase Ty1/copia-type domain-containing protein n=1 Tax=Hibiscus syriacus TaxID=106335 RepID=A0A6A2Z423_HIBSY|nr:hypothetical protein F3Y22_tig00111036pilonHSYRG00002 [Hibiscus syriacus]